MTSIVLEDVNHSTETENENTGDLSSSGLFKSVLCPTPTTFEYFTERYYHQYLFEDCKKIVGNNIRLMLHSNGLCVLCVDPSHVALQAIRSAPPEQKLSVRSVVYGSGRGNSNIATGSIGVVGKKKKNAAVCQVETKMCTLTLSDGTSYPIPACVNGFVLELNENLMKEPWMIASAPTVEGFIAVINPSAKNDFTGIKKLWTATGGDHCIEEGDL
ncbi:unnamed protein product [Phytomonas sp. EM1]|nr:unnamed protein product [Phytomonas sp. EM1]|eukprot:CCW60720.1 unnamed protein product [Phytomonas sp. isolate EM1]